MKMFPIILCGMFAALALTTRASAQVAEVRPLRGEILVNAGAGYRAIAGPMLLKPGDAAIAGSEGLGWLIYADGCSVEVVPGSVAWVQAHSPCRAHAGPPPWRDPEAILVPRALFDPSWLTDGAALIDSRKPAAGP